MVKESTNFVPCQIASRGPWNGQSYQRKYLSEHSPRPCSGVNYHLPCSSNQNQTLQKERELLVHQILGILEKDSLSTSLARLWEHPSFWGLAFVSVWNNYNPTSWECCCW